MNGPTIRSTARSVSTSARISPRALARSTIAAHDAPPRLDQVLGEQRVHLRVAGDLRQQPRHQRQRAGPRRAASTVWAVAAKSPATLPVSSGIGMSELRCTIAARTSSSLEP